MYKNIYNIYNGTNHDIHFYLQNGRRNNNNIIPTGVEPTLTYSKEIPLSVHEHSMPISTLCPIPIYSSDLPISYDMPQDYTQYDIIYVSKTYVDKISKIKSINVYDDDYRDRLYYGMPVYSEENGVKKQIGICGLIKAFPIKDPYTYITLMQQGLRPSFASIQSCIYKYQTSSNTLYIKRTLDLYNYLGNCYNNINVKM